MARELNRSTDNSSKEATEIAATLKHLGGVLGLLQGEPQSFLQAKTNNSVADLDADEIENLIQQRNTARAEKDFARADQIRDQLLEMNISLEDTTNGTIWRRN